MKHSALLITTALLASLAFSPAQAETAASAPAAKEAPKPQAAAPAGLSAEKAKLYNDTMKQAAEKNKETRAHIRKAHEEADAIVTAPAFDKKAFLTKSAEIDQLYGKARAVTNDAFVSVAEQFSQEDRKLLLQARNEHRRRQLSGN